MMQPLFLSDSLLKSNYLLELFDSELHLRAPPTTPPSPPQRSQWEVDNCNCKTGYTPIFGVESRAMHLVGWLNTCLTKCVWGGNKRTEQRIGERNK